MKCARHLCISKDTAMWFPILHIWAKGFDKRTTHPAKMEARLPLCEACKMRTKVEDLLTDEGWATICRNFKAGNFPEPDRTSVEVTFRLIKSQEKWL